MAPEWLTAKETAKILRIHTTTVHELCQRGELIAIKTGRDWRISAQGLREKAELGDVHQRLIQETAALSAEETACRILEYLAEGMKHELSVQRHKRRVS